MSGWWVMWQAWCRDHPATILYIMVMATMNLILNVIEVFFK